MIVTRNYPIANLLAINSIKVFQTLRYLLTRFNEHFHALFPEVDFPKNGFWRSISIRNLVGCTIF